MPSHCIVCSHPDREAIDRALLANGAAHTLATAYDLPYSELLIHHRDHLGPKPLPPPRSLEESRKAFQLQRLEAIYLQTVRILHEYFLTDQSEALRVVQRLEHQLQLMPRFFPAPSPNPHVSERRRIALVIDEALIPYPEARLVLAAALQRVTLDAA